MTATLSLHTQWVMLMKIKTLCTMIILSLSFIMRRMKSSLNNFLNLQHVRVHCTNTEINIVITAFRIIADMCNLSTIMLCTNWMSIAETEHIINDLHTQCNLLCADAVVNVSFSEVNKKMFKKNRLNEKMIKRNV